MSRRNKRYGPDENTIRHIINETQIKNFSGIIKGGELNDRDFMIYIENNNATRCFCIKKSSISIYKLVQLKSIVQNCINQMCTIYYFTYIHKYVHSHYLLSIEYTQF